MPLTKKLIQQYKARAHKLKPVVQTGNKGVTASLIKEVGHALTAHELIKIRIQSTDREERQKMFSEICEQCKAEPVQLIGNIGIIFRPR